MNFSLVYVRKVFFLVCYTVAGLNILLVDTTFLSNIPNDFFANQDLELNNFNGEIIIKDNGHYFNTFNHLSDNVLNSNKFSMNFNKLLQEVYLPHELNFFLLL